MNSNNKTAGVRGALTAMCLCGLVALGLSAAPAQAAKIGPYFPVPNSFNLNGIMREALLQIQASWLQNGLDNLKKARAEADGQLEKAKADKPDQVAALEEKVKKLDEEIDATNKEIAVANDSTDSREIQGERKRRFMLNLNQWINELNRLATEQMKIAILKDGMEAQVAQNRNYQLSEQADSLEKAKRDSSVENWGN